MNWDGRGRTTVTELIGEIREENEQVDEYVETFWERIQDNLLLIILVVLILVGVGMLIAHS